MKDYNKLNNKKYLFQRPDLVTTGTIVWLSSELMFFSGLFSIYFTLRANSAYLWNQETLHLNIILSSINTLILIFSSFTCQLGVHSTEKSRNKRIGKIYEFKKWGMLEWYSCTCLLGLIFIFLQLFEYKILINEGITINSNSYGSAFYITTGFHWLHVLGGVIAFLYFIKKNIKINKLNYFESSNSISIAYYWHFVDIIWIILFLIIYLLK